MEDLLEDGGGGAAHREGRHGRAARHERVRRLRGRGHNSIEKHFGLENLLEITYAVLFRHF